MQTSYNATDWKEDPTEELVRSRLSPADPVPLKRRHYPLICRVRQWSAVTQIPVGTILTYCRTKMTPACFPVEVLWVEGRAHLRKSMEADEVEILGRGK